MYHRTDLIYLYDGSFDGFLCCVFDAVYHRRFPVQIFCEDGDVPALLPLHRVETQPERAVRVLHSVPEKISRQALQLVQEAFLTCLPQKEVHMLRFLLKGYHWGGEILRIPGDNDVYALQEAVRHLHNEAHLLTGFVRFADVGGALVAQIEPKNQVLPLLVGHFAARFSGERFLIFDRTHGMALLHDGMGTQIVPTERVELPPADSRELQYRALWKQFVETVAIEARYNPLCQRTHLPLRYRGVMTEHQNFDPQSLWEQSTRGHALPDG